MTPLIKRHRHKRYVLAKSIVKIVLKHPQ